MSPRDVVAACLPDPATLGDAMTGKTCAGLFVTGTGKDGQPRATYLYHVVDNEWSMKEYGHQCVVWQTAVNPVVALELLATGAWSGRRSARPGGLRRGAVPRPADRLWQSVGSTGGHAKVMTRYGAQFGPDITFLGVTGSTWRMPRRWHGRRRGRGGTLRRRHLAPAGHPFGPTAIRQTDYLPHDGSRPHLALRVDALQDLAVVDAGDVEMPPGEIERALGALEEAVYAVASAGAVPLVLGGDHSIALPDATGVARHLGFGRVSMIHFDAHADTGDIEFGSLYGHGQPMRRLIESGALRGDRFLQMGLRGYWPGPETLDWMADQDMRSYEMTEIGKRGLDACLDEAFEIAMDDCDAVFLSVDIDVCDPGHAPGHRHPRAGRAVLARAARRRTPDLPRASRSPASTWSRCRRPTTTPRSRRTSPTGSASRRSRAWPRRKVGITHDPAGPLLEGRGR